MKPETNSNTPSFIWSEQLLLAGMLVFLFSHTAPAQSKSTFEIKQVHIPGINIRCIKQDDRGFIWIGNQDGLVRFDSKNAVVFKKSPENINSIGSSDIRDIVESKDALWITSTQGGLDKINKTIANPVLHLDQSEFQGLENNTITSLLNLDTVLYIGTEKGLYRYRMADNKIVAVRLENNFTAPYIDKLACFHDYLVLAIEDWGCLTLNIHTGKIVDSCLTANYYPAHKHRFYAASPYSTHQWLLGTSQGINTITINSSGQLHFQPNPFPYAKAGLNTDIYAITADNDKNVWFSNENNLVKIDTAGRKYSIVEAAGKIDVEFLNNVYNIYCDKENNIWLGCQNGLFYCKNAPASILTYRESANSITSIPHAYFLFPVNDSIVLVTAENGLYKVNTATRVIDEVDITQVYDFVFSDPYGRYLASNKTGLKQLKGRSLIPIQKIYPEFGAFADYTINSAVRINNAELVMGTENKKGILIWNFIQHTVKNITAGSKGIHLDNDIINGLFTIRENVFCVLTESAMIYIDYQAGTSKQIHFPRKNSNDEYGLFFDMCRVKNNYYLSSYDNGVLVLDTNFKVKKIITTGSGLSNNSVYKLLPWKDSLLFMTTNFGLDVLQVATGRIRQFYKSNGLHDDVFEETSGNSFGDRIYAGGLNGFSVIYPDRLQPAQNAPLLYINTLSIELPNRKLDTTNFEISLFSIPENALQTNVYFYGINYSTPERTTYQYKIPELHKDWLQLGTRNFITLLGMSPGTYHLMVQAFNQDGVPGEIKQLTLIFLPKWYQTGWFRVIVFVLVAGGIYGFYRFRIHQLKQLQEVRNKLAGDLHDDLGSTMNSVKIYANLAIMEKNSDKYLLQVKESVQEAIVGIRDMIWVLDDKKDTFEHLLTRISTFAKPVCEANDVLFHQQITDDAFSYRLAQEERRNLYMIMKESINNSLKYARASEVRIEVVLKKNKPLIIITDNGQGFDTTKTTEGNGLKNMVRRAGDIKYQLHISSAPGNGTEIQLQKM